MQSLSKAFSTLKLGAVKTLPLQSVRPIHTTTDLSRRSRDYYGFRQEAGRAIPGKRSFRGPGGGMPQKYWHRNGVDDGKGKYSAARKRVAMFQQEANLTAGVEDLPMFWMMNKMSDQEKRDMENEKRVEKWKVSMYNRGYEPAIRKVEEGPVFRYRTTHQQRVARKRRLQIQYETHFIRLRALSKNGLLPKALTQEASEYKWMLQNGRFADLRGFDREQIICRLHGRPTSVRPRWAVKRFPMRLLTDYGEGMCGNMRDYHGRRQREYYVDFCRRKQPKRKPRQWFRNETYYRYQYTK